MFVLFCFVLFFFFVFFFLGGGGWEREFVSSRLEIAGSRGLDTAPDLGSMEIFRR